MRLLLISITFIVSSTFLHSQGLIFDKDGFLDGDKIEITRDDRIPNVASLKRYTPYVLTQNRSNCVAYSVATARTMLFARDYNVRGKDTITSCLFSPHWVYYRNKELGDTDCMNGLNLEKVSVDVLNNGIPPMFSVEYDDYYPWGQVELCNFYPNSYEEDKLTASKYKVEDVYRLQNLEEIQLAISKGMPCVVGMLIPESFKSRISKDVWEPTSSDSYGNSYGHAMVVVGYDNYKYGGAVEIMNSWGERWGNNGFIWIRYEDFLKYTLGVYAYDTQVKLGAPAEITVDAHLLKDKTLSTNLDTSTINKFNELRQLMDKKN